jgi:hypothetical protein
MLRKVIVVIGIMQCLGVVSCNLFKTRTPDEPSEQSSNYIPPTTPELVFQNIVNAFHDMNSVNYISSFADTVNSNFVFTFEPTPQARLRYSSFDEWTKFSEEQYFKALQSKLQTGASPTLEFLTLTQQGIASDSIQYEATYRLTVPHTQSNIPTQVHGSAQFFLVSDKSRNWFIRRWDDFAQNQNDSTWSDLKGSFAQYVGN